MKTVEIKSKVTLVVNNVRPVTGNMTGLLVPTPQPTDDTKKVHSINVDGQLLINNKEFSRFSQRFDLTDEEANDNVSIAGYDNYIFELGLKKVSEYLNV